MHSSCRKLNNEQGGTGSRRLTSVCPKWVHNSEKGTIRRTKISSFMHVFERFGADSSIYIPDGNRFAHWGQSQINSLMRHWRLVTRGTPPDLFLTFFRFFFYGHLGENVNFPKIGSWWIKTKPLLSRSQHTRNHDADIFDLFSQVINPLSCFRQLFFPKRCAGSMRGNVLCQMIEGSLPFWSAPESCDVDAHEKKRRNYVCEGWDRPHCGDLWGQRGQSKRGGSVVRKTWPSEICQFLIGIIIEMAFGHL